jgi:hypothetical protein
MSSDDQGLELSIREPRLRSLYRYWLGKSAAGVLPSRADIDPLEMKEWLGNLMLVEFNGDVHDYRVRLDGTNLEQYYGNRRSGRGVEVLTSEEERKLLMEQYGAVLECRRPAYYEADFTNSDGVFSRQMKLVLPLSADKKSINMVLVGIYFREERD